jgi:hypothetical protein
MITGKLYDRLKFLAQIGLPALATLYFSLAGLWGLPAAEQVVGTIVAFDAFLGVLLGVSQANYNKTIEDGGELHITMARCSSSSTTRRPIVSKLADKTEVRFKVKKQPTAG